VSAQQPLHQENPYEALIECLIDDMTQAMLAAHEQALVKMLASPDNQLDPVASRQLTPFILALAAFAASSQLEGVEEARESFNLAAASDDEPLNVQLLLQRRMPQ
jgi:hypothetical protein